jgi:hypothetical protein
MTIKFATTKILKVDIIYEKKGNIIMSHAFKGEGKKKIGFVTIKK